MKFDLSQVTIALAEDLQKLRDGSITNSDGRTRAILARELLRSVQLQLDGMKVIEAHNSNILLPGKKR